MNLLPVHPARGTLHHLRPLKRIAGIGGDDLHPYQKAVEAAEAGDAGADGDRAWLLTGEPGAVAPGEDILRSYLVWSLADPPEEVLQHARVTLDRPHRA